MSVSNACGAGDRSWWRRHYTFSGTALGLAFVWLSLTPSPLPRGPLYQGLLSGMAMAFAFFPSSPLHPSSPVYRFLMQVGMIIGFATAWPAIVWLIRRGIKEVM